jgi:hypothetical protein
MLTYADICLELAGQTTSLLLLTYADVCWRMLTYADRCVSGQTMSLLFEDKAYTDVC